MLLIGRLNGGSDSSSSSARSCGDVVVVTADGNDFFF